VEYKSLRSIDEVDGDVVQDSEGGLWLVVKTSESTTTYVPYVEEEEEEVGVGG
jgi:hypothetical protein